MLNSEDFEVADRQDITDVFATLYEELYKSRRANNGIRLARTPTPAEEPFTLRCAVLSLTVMKLGRKKDEARVIVEILKDGSR